MTFLSTSGFLLRKSNGSFSKITSDKGLRLFNYDKNANTQTASLIFKENLSVLDYYFDIKENNSIYGLVVSKRRDLFYIYINKKIILRKNIFSITNQTQCIKFPYVILINNKFHIFFYLVDNLTSTCKLMHLFNEDNKWRETIIDTFRFNILTNFSLIKNKDSLNIFYIKLINNIEQICITSFNIDSSTWQSPYPITNSHNAKVYLSVIKNNRSEYHLTYSENINNKYFCMYIKGYTLKDKFICSKNSIIRSGVACTFPNIIQYSNMLSIQWIEFNSLHSCVSSDLGQSWNYSLVDANYMDDPFSLYYYRSNYSGDRNNIFPNVFTLENKLKFLGIRYIYT